ncbi:MAG: YraN family protein [Firmicutes bacterium]|nr:YraN family protein [Bacillota bacterium]
MSTYNPTSNSRQLNRAKGYYYEQIIVEYLQDNGYIILDTNWYCQQGEIDIIAQKDGIKVFVEVKSRKSNRYGTGLDAINYTKQKRISNASLAYLIENNSLNSNIRYDAIQVDSNNEIFHVQDAFYSTVRY